MKKISLALLLATLAACGDQYRYPCQNPDNWDKPLCQKPTCDVNRTCPEHIFKGSDPARMLPPGAPIPESLKPLAGAASAAAPLPPRSPVPISQFGACK